LAATIAKYDPIDVLDKYLTIT